MGYFGGYEVDRVDGFPFILNSIICNLEWRVSFSFSFPFFYLEKITSLSFAEISWILCSFEWEAFVEWTCGIWDGDCRGDIAGKSGCQYPEWVTDRPAMFGLANGGFFCGMKTCRWQVPFPKWMHHSTKLKVTSDSSKRFMQYKALDGSFLPWETFTKISFLKEFRGVPY